MARVSVVIGQRWIALPAKERERRLGRLRTLCLGLPEVNTALWSGLFVQAATPAPIVKKLEETLRRAIADPDVSAKLKAMAVDPGGNASKEFRAMIDADITTTEAVVKAANLEFKE